MAEGGAFSRRKPDAVTGCSFPARDSAITERSRRPLPVPPMPITASTDPARKAASRSPFCSTLTIAPTACAHLATNCTAGSSTPGLVLTMSRRGARTRSCVTPAAISTAISLARNLVPAARSNAPCTASPDFGNTPSPGATGAMICRMPPLTMTASGGAIASVPDGRAANVSIRCGGGSSGIGA